MLTVADLQHIADFDWSTVDRDILEFNHKQLARNCIHYIKAIDHQHRAEIQRYRHLIGTAEHATTLLARARREGRKTIRINDLLDAAEAAATDQQEGHSTQGEQP